MAAEYRPDLKEAVDILINGPAEARIPKIQPKTRTARLRSWASTPFRWLAGQHPFPEATPEPSVPLPRSGFTELPQERRAQLTKEVYQLFDGIYDAANTHSWLFTENNRTRYQQDIYYNIEKPPAELELSNTADEDGSRPVFYLYLGNNSPSFFEQRFFDATFTDQGALPWLTRMAGRTSYETGVPEPVELKPYSPSIDLLALKTLGEEVKRLQDIRLIDEDLD